MRELRTAETDNDVADEANKAVIEEAKAKGWYMRNYGSGMFWFGLFDVRHRGYLQVSIAKRMPCPVCQPLTSEQAAALAWDELLDWINPDKLRRLIERQ